MSRKLMESILIYRITFYTIQKLKCSKSLYILYINYLNTSLYTMLSEFTLNCRWYKFSKYHFLHIKKLKKTQIIRHPLSLYGFCTSEIFISNKFLKIKKNVNKLNLLKIEATRESWSGDHRYPRIPNLHSGTFKVPIF